MSNNVARVRRAQLINTLGSVFGPLVDALWVAAQGRAVRHMARDPAIGHDTGNRSDGVGDKKRPRCVDRYVDARKMRFTIWTVERRRLVADDQAWIDRGGDIGAPVRRRRRSSIAVESRPATVCPA